jgi:hypothetical protein
VLGLTACGLLGAQMAIEAVVEPLVRGVGGALFAGLGYSMLPDNDKGDRYWCFVPRWRSFHWRCGRERGGDRPRLDRTPQSGTDTVYFPADGQRSSARTTYARTPTKVLLSCVGCAGPRQASTRLPSCSAIRAPVRAPDHWRLAPHATLEPATVQPMLPPARCSDCQT